MVAVHHPSRYALQVARRVLLAGFATFGLMFGFWQVLLNDLRIGPGLSEGRSGWR